MPAHHTLLARFSSCLLCTFLLCMLADAQTAPSGNAQNPAANPSNLFASPSNLLANPSFEDVNTCSEYNQPCSPSAWFFANRKVTSGYFPRYPSATGERHLQIVVASRETTNRQYWETMLLCPLQAGEKYTVSLKVSSQGPGQSPGQVAGQGAGQGAGGRPNLRDLGFWFTDRFIFSRLDTLLQPRSYLKFTDATVKDLKNGWFEIDKEFTPARGAAFLIIGNFYGLTNPDIMDQRQKPTGTIEIGVDDVAIIPVRSALCADHAKRKDSLYAILRRHSDVDSGDTGIDSADRTPQPVVPPQTAPPQAAPTKPVSPQPGASRPDTPSRPPAFPDTPRLNPTRTDTLIIHNIQFQFDRYLVDNPDTLQRFKAVLTRPGIKGIRVVGFTDDKGSQSYNQELSEKRAHEVARLLTTEFGIPDTLIRAEGKGISRDYKDPTLNRRVEIYIFH
jgi:outer membrane protein OmpA-like peptidoglycan-associated protein